MPNFLKIYLFVQMDTVTWIVIPFLISLFYSIVPVPGVLDVRTFTPGLYRCGKELRSLNAGNECKTHTDCPSNVDGVYAHCGCTYSDQSKRCDILHSNTEYIDFLDAVK